MWQVAVLLLILLAFVGHQTLGSWQGLKSTDGHLEVSSDNDRNINLETSGRSYININSDNVLQIAQKVQRASRIVQKFKHNDMSDLDDSLQRVEMLVNMARERIQHLENVSAIVDPSTGRPINLRVLFVRVRYLRTRMTILRNRLMKDECLINPCRNGGTCLDRFNNFHCLCPKNWEGLTCEEDVNECANFAGTDLGCQNNAICTNLVGSYKCECRPGWIGLHCTSKVRDCDVSGSTEMCANGYCINQDGRVACLCHQGWEMDLSGQCTVDVDECAGKKPVCSHDPLVLCYNTPGSFHCGPCPAGYSGNGYQCKDINECEVDNGGCSKYPKVKCINVKGSRVCGECPVGYTGDGVTCLNVGGGACSVDNGGCHQVATCIPILGDIKVECRCPIGYTGDGIGPNGCHYNPGISNTDCSKDPCKNGGTCTSDSPYTYKCQCPPLFTGLNCDTAIPTPCDNKPCQNGGKCSVTSIFSVDGYKCSCMFGFTGDTCELTTNDCVGSVTLDSGILVYPKEGSSNLPQSMEVNSHSELCHWQIEVDATKLVQISFSTLQLTSDGACNSYVQVYDGSTYFSDSLGKFCTSQIPTHVIKSTTNVISVYANISVSRQEKFQLSWKSIDASCVKYLTISNTSLIIESPGYPFDYPANLDCFWHLTVSEGMRIDLVFYTLSIENSPLCHKDYLKVFDHDSTDVHSLLRQHCNISEVVTPLRSKSHQTLLYFHSDDSGSAAGFRIGIHAVVGCGGVLSEPFGEITPPLAASTSDILHENDLFCEWRIQLPINDKIRFWFTEFDIEKCTEACSCDYLEIHNGVRYQSPVIGKYCGNIIPGRAVSTTNTLTVIFKTDALTNKRGFVMKYETYCGGHFTESSGELLSPYYPKKYPGEITCEYVVELPVGNIIKLEVLDFDVEDMPFELDDFEKCPFDYLEIHDGHDANAPLIDKYCGGVGKIPTEIISKFNFLYLKFSTDNTQHDRGFKIKYSTIDVVCGGIIKDKKGSISSPLEDNAYPPNTRCTWLIIAPIGSAVHIKWVSFHLVWTYNCSTDYVQIFENSTSTGNGTHLMTLCGWFIPLPITSTQNMITIVFQSDGWLNRDGFKLNYTILDPKISCGGTYHSAAGAIKSPNYPQKYPPHLNCIWNIQAPKGQQIRLNILDFKIERLGYIVGCVSDFLEIRNGGYDTSPMIGVYCGSTIPATILSFSNALHIKFSTDTTVAFKGFHITWDSSATGCGGILSAPSGSFVSPNFPRSYSSRSDCSWRINIAAGSKIRLNIVELELQNSVNCENDYVEVYDGVNTNAKSLGRFCSGVYPQHLFSSSNHLFVKFVSDFGVESKGFRMDYSTDCNIELTGHRGVIESLNFPDEYPLEIECKWTIKVPRGNNISIAFSHFDLEEIYDGICRDYFDFLEIVDKRNNHKIGKFCGKNIPNKISASEEVYLHFQSDISLAGSGFRLEWALEGCGGVLKDPNYGFFKSPNHPNTYPPNTVCEWHISVPLQYSIQISIIVYQIESSPKCEKASLKIYGGVDDTGPLLSNLCGNVQKDSSVHVSGSHAFIRFAVNSTHGGKGFLAHYYTTISGCGGTFSGASGQITSHNYPKNYERNEVCEWSVDVNLNHVINFTFVDFDVPPSPSNLVVVYDNAYSFESVNLPVIFNSTGRLEELTAHSFMSKSSVLYIRHESGDSMPAKGFRAVYHEACGARIGSDFTRRSRGFLSHEHATLDTYCEYYIISPVIDSVITLAIRRLQLKPEMNVSIYDGETDEDTKLLKVLSGNKSPPEIISTGPAMTVKVFNPNRQDFNFEAEYSMFDEDCGGDLSSEQGTFTSPKYPDGYPVNVECIWTIISSPGNTVMLTFLDFSLEKDSGFCNEDYVEIRNGSANGNMLGLYCGDSLPANITVSNTLWIKFHSDKVGTARGFVADYTLVVESNLYGPEGYIASPLYPSMYHGQGKYTWTITVAQNHVMRIVFQDFFISHDITQTDCINYLKISDSSVSGSSSTLAKLCGAEVPETILSTTESVSIEFNTQLDTAQGMFYLSWEQVSKWSQENSRGEDDNCSQIIRLGSGTGMQNYSITNDNATLLCSKTVSSHLQKWIWVVETSPFFHLVLNVVKIRCQNGRLKIFTESENDVWNLLTTIPSHCDEEGANSYPTVRSKQRMKLIYTFNNIYKNIFESFVKIECGESVNVQNTVRLDTYILPWNRTGLHHCVWKLSTTLGRTIRVIFRNFSLPTHDGDACNYNYIELRNGAYEDSPFLGVGRYCGSDKPPLLETASNKLYITYHANTDLVNHVGMIVDFVEISQTCGHEIRLNLKDSVILSTPGQPIQPKPHITCIWRVVAPTGHSVHFQMNDNTVFRNECDKEYLLLRDGSTEVSEVLEHMCDTKTPMSSKVTEGNMLLVKYFTDVDRPTPFSAEVKVATCGGTIFVSFMVKQITSPNYPKEYPANTNCTWHIKSNTGSTLYFKFTTLDIRRHNNCSSNPDYIEIIQLDLFTNQPTGVQKIFCGQLDSYSESESQITFNTSSALVRFISGGGLDAWGSKKHFSFEVVSNRASCEHDYTTPSGVIESPGFPQVQSPTFCLFKIKVEPGQKIKLKILDLDLDPYSSLDIFQDNNLIYMVWSWETKDFQKDSVIEFVSNSITIRYYTYRMSQHRGFKIEFTTEEHSPCGGNLEASGVVNFPGESAFSFVQCLWERKTTEMNTTFSVDIQGKLGTTGKPDYCPNSNVSMIITKGYFYSDMATICGNYETQTTIVRSPFPVTKILLSKNKHNHLTPDVNFTLTYKTYPCGGVIRLANEINITSPGYPADYPPNMDCAWKVELSAPVTQMRVAFKFLDVDTTNDFVSVYTNGYSFSSAHLVGTYRGTLLPEPFTATTYDSVWIIFHSDSNNQGKGFKIQVTPSVTDCGGVETYFTGFIYTPGYWSTQGYPDNIECEWQIHVEPGYHIHLTFPGHFHLENSTNCTNDYLQVFDFVNNNWVPTGSKLCGRPDVSSISYNSTSNRMKLLFHSNEETTGNGFNAVWDVNCGGNVVIPDSGQGIIISPNYPKQYVGGLDCKYEIKAPKKIITGKFLHFALEEGDNNQCTKDNLTIIPFSILQMGHSLQYSSLINSILSSRSFCGTDLPPKIQSRDRLTLHFKTDYTVSNTGFLFSYSVEPCGKANITEPTNIDIPRNRKLDCEWVIKAPVDQMVVLRVEKESVTSIWQNIDCSKDYIRVWTGTEKTDICLYSPSVKLYSTGSNMTIQYHTEIRPIYDTFMFIYFRYACTKTISLDLNAPPKVISPLGNPDGNYEPDMECRWFLLAPLSYNIKLTFTDMDLDNNCTINTSCSCDYIEIYDGDSITSNKIGTYCGSTKYPSIMSVTNVMLVVFISDSAVNKRGFNLTVEPVLSLCGVTRQIIPPGEVRTLTSPNWGQLYPNNLNCSWILATNAPYSTLHIHFISLDIEKSLNCSKDRLEVFDIVNPEKKHQYIINGFIRRAESAMTVCGHSASDYYSFTNSLQVRLISDSETTGKGFKLEYRYDDCQRNLVEPYGRIYVAMALSACRIHIKAPQKNNTISLYFTHFRITTCGASNSVQIFDGSDPLIENKRIGTLCGLSRPKPVYSSGDEMLILYKPPSFAFYLSMFDILYTATDQGQGCGGRLFGSKGTLTSPFYPDTFRNASECRWDVSVPYKYSLHFSFIDFNIGSPETCSSDYLQIGETGNEEVLRWQFCGQEKPSDVEIATGEAYIRYVTSVHNNGTGWELMFFGK